MITQAHFEGENTFDHFAFVLQVLIYANVHLDSSKRLHTHLSISH